MIRSHCKHVENGGNLKSPIPEPTFLADQGHHVKVVVKPFFGMVTTRKDLSRCKCIDAMQSKKYTACYLAQSRAGLLKQSLDNILVLVEYLFNHHSFCDPVWCWGKEIDNKMFEIMSTSIAKTVGN